MMYFHDISVSRSILSILVLRAPTFQMDASTFDLEKMGITLVLDESQRSLG